MPFQPNEIWKRLPLALQLISSANPALASVPSEVKVPAGANSATFSITTHAVAAESSSVITAAVSGAERSATLTVAP